MRLPCASTRCMEYVLPFASLVLYLRLVNSSVPSSARYTHSFSSIGAWCCVKLISSRLAIVGSRLRSLTASNTSRWSHPPWQWNSTLPSDSVIERLGFLSPLPCPWPGTGQEATHCPFTCLALPSALAIVSVSIFSFSLFEGKKKPTGISRRRVQSNA